MGYPMQITDPLLKVHEVAWVRGTSIPTVYRHVQKGILPKPIKLGGSARWPQSEILASIEKAKAARGVAA